MLLSIIYRFSSQGSAPSSGFSLPCAPGEDSCGWGGHSGLVVPSNQRTWGSANELLSLFKADVLFLSRPYQDLVARQVPFENPVISPQCPSTPFHCNFNAQRILPILSNFLLEKCIKFQPRNILSFEIHRFIPHYVSWKSSSATLGMKNLLNIQRNDFAVASHAWLQLALGIDGTFSCLRNEDPGFSGQPSLAHTPVLCFFPAIFQSNTHIIPPLIHRRSLWRWMHKWVKKQKSIYGYERHRDEEPHPVPILWGPGRSQISPTDLGISSLQVEFGCSLPFNHRYLL